MVVRDNQRETDEAATALTAEPAVLHRQRWIAPDTLETFPVVEAAAGITVTTILGHHLGAVPGPMSPEPIQQDN